MTDWNGLLERDGEVCQGFTSSFRALNDSSDSCVGRERRKLSNNCVFLLWLLLLSKCACYF